MTYVDYFSNLGFNFDTDLKKKVIDIEEEATLSRKLLNSVFFYKSPNNTNTSFYIVTTTLEETELQEFRKYVWNKNDADIIFYYPDGAEEMEMLYAKYSPRVTNKDSVLRTFSTSQKDLDTIETIKHWQFDSGVFWLNYKSFIDKAKYKGIDKELVATLKALKEQLNKLLAILISDDDKKNEVVQALIDRTLYIKYLEDKHIINSYFFNHYFNDEELNYKKLLENNSNTDINKLYKIIHEIFNNALFDQPTIDDKYLTDGVRKLIADSFNHNVNSGQLRLFDFRFDVLPVEFISYIYEVFLSEKQKENGIYYTPKKLAQLIVDEVITEDEIGSILDPSSGSGMFLITGYQRLLEIAKKQGLEPKNNIEKIKFRTKLLSDNIFGIEKESTAQRFTLFSLSLQIFVGINPSDIKEFIASELEQKNEINLFNEVNFYQNIIRQNTLDIEKKAFESKKFRYIIGNPPFVRKEVNEDAKYFTNNYELDVFNKKIIAKDVIDGYQISQCFLLKIKEWSDNNTRLGFISNSSNFYNEANKFQDFFYSNYGIEKIYELSRVKKILFEKAKESVIAIIFTNNFQDNIIDYYPVDLGLFSEKPFELLIIQEDKVIEIAQSKLIEKELRLRDFLVGNEYDNVLISNLGNNSKLKDFYSSIGRGFQIWGETARKKEYGITKQVWNKLKEDEQDVYLQKFINKYFSDYLTNVYNKPYIKPSNLRPFVKLQSKKFIGDLTNFERPIKDNSVYIGKKLMFTRIGSKLNCVYSKSDDYFDFSVYTIKLKDDNNYYLFQAILNSYIVQYYLDFYLRKRVLDSFSRIGNDDILSIPIPKENSKLESEISDISKKLTGRILEYSEIEHELNELIYELYELSYWEKQRVRDYFLPKSRIGRKKTALDNYKNTLSEILGFYVESPILIEEAKEDFNLIVVKISFDSNSNNPKATKVRQYLLNEIFEENPNENFLASQEKIYGNDCVYIIKEDINKNWTETKAFEDGQDILKHLIPNENGETVH
ncbi:Eco57I restriction-modification methylase domain-containing protein [Flavobacterium lindanitolerans]|uniref:Eco57I restriction-modification methylase domain-containing protein n=1 Tax=Flavobacterium lindanitolerans TaxID=428988 RepID=UPI0031D1457A